MRVRRAHASRPSDRSSAGCGRAHHQLLRRPHGRGLRRPRRPDPDSRAGLRGDLRAAHRVRPALDLRLVRRLGCRPYRGARARVLSDRAGARPRLPDAYYHATRTRAFGSTSDTPCRTRTTVAARPLPCWCRDRTRTARSSRCATGRVATLESFGCCRSPKASATSGFNTASRRSSNASTTRASTTGIRDDRLPPNRRFAQGAVARRARFAPFRFSRKAALTGADRSGPRSPGRASRANDLHALANRAGDAARRAGWVRQTPRPRCREPPGRRRQTVR